MDAGNLDTVVVGTGPMILTEAVDGSHIAFDKNPDYWEERGAPGRLWTSG